MLSVELAGDEEDILTQLLKLSEDNLKVPEQEVLSELVVTEVLSIASEKVTEMLLLIETPLWLSVGEIDETVGAVVSITNEPIFNVTLLHQLFHLSLRLITKVCFQLVRTFRRLSPRQWTPLRSPLTHQIHPVRVLFSYLQTISVIVCRCLLLPPVLIHTRRLQLTPLIIFHIPLLTRFG